MADAGSNKLTLADLVDLEVIRQHDEEQDPAWLRKRDEAIGRSLPTDASNRAALIAWVRALRDKHDTLPGTGVAGALRVAGTVALLIGLLLGALTTLGLLNYTGKTPINVFHFLAVMVVMQVLLILAWALTMAPARVLANLPIVSDLHTLLRWISPGRWMLAVMKRLPARWRQHTDTQQGWLNALAQRHGELMYLAAARLAQTLGIGFNLAAVVTMFTMVYFTDIRFGWSTTLERDRVATSLHQFTEAVSAPWAWWQDARPTPEMVRATAYEKPFIEVPEAAGHRKAWWPFLFAALLTYGLVPRLIAWLYVVVRQRRQLDRISFDHPDYTAALRRLRSSHVTLSSDAAEQQPSTRQAEHHAAAPPRQVGQAFVLTWRCTLDDAAVKAVVNGTLDAAPVSIAHAPGVDADADRQAVAAAGRTDAPALLLLARAWEAPTRDLRAALQQLRASLGKRPITVILIEMSDAGAATAPATDDVTMWQSKLAELGDPQLFVAPAEVSA